MAENKAAQSSADTPGAAAVKAFADLQKAGLGPMGWMGAGMLEQMSQIGMEVTQFIADRIREDVKTQRQILHCKDAEEMRQIQTRFMERAIEQYTAETGKLVDMGTEMMSAALGGKNAD